MAEDILRRAAASQYQYAADYVRECAALESEALMPWARGNDGAYVHHSDDGGATFQRTVMIDTAPFRGGYGMRGAIELPDGDLMLPLSDVPHYERVFVVHSSDHGQRWGAPITAASEQGKAFEEPCALLLSTGRIVMLLRENRSRHLHQVVSDDGGRSWSRPGATSIDGYPPHLLALGDDHILCTYGHRRPDYSIRSVLSVDGGKSWDTGQTFVISGSLANRDLGYPCTLRAADGRLVSVYYAQGVDGVTSIRSVSFRL